MQVNANDHALTAVTSKNKAYEIKGYKESKAI